MRFVDSRVTQKEKNGAWNKGSEYTEEEIDLCAQLKMLNQNGESSEAIRQTS